MIYRTYQLRDPHIVQAVQWGGDNPEDMAEKIVNWVNQHGVEIAGYSSTAAGPLGPDKQDWGLFTLTQDGPVVWVRPMDYITRDAYGKFFSVEPHLFEAVYHDLTEHE